MIELKKTTKEDLETLFIFQTNNVGIRMAAFTSENPSDKEAYLKKWTAIVDNPKINMQTIRLESKIVGSVIHFDIMKETNVSYWIDQKYWGKGNYVSLGWGRRETGRRNFPAGSLGAERPQPRGLGAWAPPRKKS